MSKDRSQAQSGLSVATLLIASASSLVSAVVVSKIWGGGTLIGAAVTPVIVALVSEGLHRPTRAIKAVRDTRAVRYDPVAEGRRGLREGDFAHARPSGAADQGRRVHRAGGPLSWSRRRVALAVATGLAAFGVAGVVLTGSELVFGNSAVSSSEKRTTFLGGQSEQAKSERDTSDEQRTNTTTTEAPPADTTPEEGGEQTVPDAERQTPPAAPSPDQTAPTPSPAPTAPPAEPTPQAPAPTTP